MGEAYGSSLVRLSEALPFVVGTIHISGRTGYAGGISWLCSTCNELVGVEVYGEHENGFLVIGAYTVIKYNGCASVTNVSRSIVRF